MGLTWQAEQDQARSMQEAQDRAYAKRVEDEAIRRDEETKALLRKQNELLEKLVRSKGLL